LTELLALKEKILPVFQKQDVASGPPERFEKLFLAV
jgi:hypothetical protein